MTPTEYLKKLREAYEEGWRDAAEYCGSNASPPKGGPYLGTSPVKPSEEEVK